MSINKLTAGRGVLYALGLAASVLSMAGLAEFDVVSGALDLRPFNLYAVGGAIASKHAMLPCMARDYGAKDQEGLDSAAEEARKLGFWLVVHNVGSGDHLHLQGLAPGAPPEWWLAKYGG